MRNTRRFHAGQCATSLPPAEVREPSAWRFAICSAIDFVMPSWLVIPHGAGRRAERGREPARWEMICLRRGEDAIRMALSDLLCNRFCHAILVGHSTRRWSAGRIVGCVPLKPTDGRPWA
jgi:hypothetical protein